MHAIGTRIAIGLTVALALGACAGDDDDGGGGGNGAAAAGPGFEDCADDPNACNGGERADGGTITWAVNTLPGAWNTYSPEGGSIYTSQMLHGIYPHTGYWEPDRATFKHNFDLLAEEPQLLGEDPFSFQFVIREEAVWDDGTPITADDFIVSWKLGTSEVEGHCTGCRPRSTGRYDQVASVEGSDDGKTVTITLKDGEANPEWFGMFGADDIGAGLMPAHVAEENGFDIDDPAAIGQYFEWLNSTMPEFSGGPYRLAEGDLENQVIKEPNPEWYGEAPVTLETYVLRFLTDQGAWVPALSNGEIQGGSPPQFNEDIVRELQGMDDVNLNIGPGPSWEHLDFNLDVPAFQDVALRQAIFTAVDVEAIATQTVGELVPDVTLRTNHIFSADSPHHVDNLTGSGQGSGDVEAALAILEEAGYEFDGTTLTRDGQQVGPFRLRSTGDQLRATAMQLIQAQLAQIGVEVTIEPTDNLGGMLGEQDYDIAQYGWSGSPFFTESPFTQWHSTSASNFGRYSNPEVDELVTQALNAPTLEASAELINQANELVVADAYVLPIMDSPVYAFVSDEYVGVRDNAGSSLRALYNNHEWGLVAQ